jgi:K+-transporting ATPase c subunit
LVVRAFNAFRLVEDKDALSHGLQSESRRLKAVSDALVQAITHLTNVPGDVVTTSGSGLDPHITLDNAQYQLDRVASKWATDTKRNPTEVRTEIEQMLQTDSFAPLGGLVGEKMINGLQVNLELAKHYGAPQG